MKNNAKILSVEVFRTKVVQEVEDVCKARLLRREMRQKTASLGAAFKWTIAAKKLPKLHSPNTSLKGNLCRRNSKRGGHNGGAGKSDWLPRGLAN
jgi:hypothetical protein